MLLYRFTDLFNVCNNATAFLVKDNRTLILLLHLPCCLVEVNEGNSAWYRHVARKRRTILVVFLVTIGGLVVSADTAPNTSDSFLKGELRCGFEIMAASFSCSFFEAHWSTQHSLHPPQDFTAFKLTFACAPLALPNRSIVKWWGAVKLTGTDASFPKLCSFP